MAYHLSDEDIVQESVKNPDWVLFYHRPHLKRLLPAMAQAYLLVGKVQEELLASQKRDEELAITIKDNRRPECVANWPECENGKYHPKCCRFPKSCSCGY
jgi:hypothetical protein